MKSLRLLILSLTISNFVISQEQKVEIVPDSLFFSSDAYSVQKSIRLSCGARAVTVQMVSSDYFLPFKVYELYHNKENWTDSQSLYSAISAKVPGLKIKNGSNISAPKIQMRGNDITIVIVDGISYDASILNSLCPADIESVKVSNYPGAQHYF